MRLQLLAGLITGAAVSSAVALAITHRNAYSNDSIHNWACNKVIIPYDDAQVAKGHAPEGGCYNICFTLAGGTYDAKTGIFTMKQDNIDSSYPDDLINACAITLNGAEW